MKMQLKRKWVIILISVLFGTAAFAHANATGVVKERMDHMNEMAEIIKEIALVMRGMEEYDPDRIRAAGEALRLLSGENITVNFPAGSMQKASYASPMIWESWDNFSEIALDLESYAEALIMAADYQVNSENYAGETSAAAFQQIAKTCSACHRDYRVGH